MSNNTGVSQFPQIAAIGNNVFVTWEDSTIGNDDIFFAASNNNGTSFGTPIILSNVTRFEFPQIAASGNNVYVTWQDSSTPRESLFAVSNNNGMSFGTPINLSNNLSNNAAFSLLRIAASGSNNVYVTWQDNTPGNFIFLITNTQPFGTAVNISNNPGTSQFPQIAVS